MKRTLRPEELRLWARVARHARPGPGRRAPAVEPDEPLRSLRPRVEPEGDALPRLDRGIDRKAPGAIDQTVLRRVSSDPPSGQAGGSEARTPADLGPLKAFAERDPSRDSARPVGLSPATLELDPRRRQRIVRERDPIEARLDLHGLTHDDARGALERFIRRAHADQARAVLVITGKGTTGEGVLRRFAPEWLRGPVLRPLIAGVSEADRRHGGAGALYVVLKRRG